MDNKSYKLGFNISIFDYGLLMYNFLTFLKSYKDPIFSCQLYYSDDMELYVSFSPTTSVWGYVHELFSRFSLKTDNLPKYNITRLDYPKIYKLYHIIKGLGGNFSFDSVSILEKNIFNQLMPIMEQFDCDPEISIIEGLQNNDFFQIYLAMGYDSECKHNISNQVSLVMKHFSGEECSYCLTKVYLNFIKNGGLNQHEFYDCIVNLEEQCSIFRRICKEMNIRIGEMLIIAKNDNKTHFLTEKE